MSVPISLKNKGGIIAAEKLEKIVLGACGGFSLYGKLLPNHFTA